MLYGELEDSFGVMEPFWHESQTNLLCNGVAQTRQTALEKDGNR